MMYIESLFNQLTSSAVVPTLLGITTSWSIFQHTDVSVALGLGISFVKSSLRTSNMPPELGTDWGGAGARGTTAFEREVGLGREYQQSASEDTPFHRPKKKKETQKDISSAGR